MSYTSSPSGYYYSSYSQYDIAALNWLYGKDGLQSSWGMGTNGLYYTGTSSNDTFTSSWTPASGYNIAYTGGGGTDTLVLSVAKTSVTCFTYPSSQSLVVSATSGNEMYVNPDIETIQFSDGSWSVASLISAANGGDIYGTEAADSLIGTSGNDRIYALGGNDTISSGAGNDIIDGGTGIDTAVISSLRSARTVSTSGSSYIVSDSANTDTDTIYNVERLKFSDTMLALDISANPGKVYRLYQAAFNRTPDTGGLGFWINAADKGSNLVTDAAAGFINSPEFISLYGANPTNGEFVALLYNNVLHRSLDQGGYDFWVNALSSGSTRPEILYSFSESTENQTNVASVIASGIAYQEWIG